MYHKKYIEINLLQDFNTFAISIFETICNTYYVIHCKIQMICYINLQKLITVQCMNETLNIEYSYIVFLRQYDFKPSTINRHVSYNSS